MPCHALSPFRSAHTPPKSLPRPLCPKLLLSLDSLLADHFLVIRCYQDQNSLFTSPPISEKLQNAQAIMGTGQRWPVPGWRRHAATVPSPFPCLFEQLNGHARPTRDSSLAQRRQSKSKARAQKGANYRALSNSGAAYSTNYEEGESLCRMPEAKNKMLDGWRSSLSKMQRTRLVLQVE